MCETALSLTTASTTPYGTRFITTDGAYVYWIDGSGTGVWKVAVTGGTATQLPSLNDHQQPSGIAVDATSLYWGDENGSMIMKLTPK